MYLIHQVCFRWLSEIELQETSSKILNFEGDGKMEEIVTAIKAQCRTEDDFKEFVLVGYLGDWKDDDIPNVEIKEGVVFASYASRTVGPMNEEILECTAYWCVKGELDQIFAAVVKGERKELMVPDIVYFVNIPRTRLAIEGDLEFEDEFLRDYLRKNIPVKHFVKVGISVRGGRI